MQRLSAVVLASSLAAGCALARTPPPDVYDVRAATQFEQTQRTDAHLAVTEPTAVGALDSERVVVRLTPTEISFLGRAQWSDRLPRLVQRRLIESFQNSDRVGSVGPPGGAIVNDVGLVLDLRAFQVDVAQNRAEVEFEARIVSDDTGRVVASRRFSATAPLSGSERADMIRALDTAFQQVAAEIVDWTLARV